MQCKIALKTTYNNHSMLKFISLGSGSCGNCYYLNADGYGIIIDLGIGIRNFKKHFSNYGLTIAQIQAILVTHDHTDHVKAVGALSRDFHIPVYTSEKVHDSIMHNHFVSKKVPLNLQHNIVRGEEFELGPFNITSFAVPHDSADNNGYIIKTDSKCLVLMTDVGHFTDEMPNIVNQATHLIIESNYDKKMLATGHYPLRLQKRISSGYGHISNDETAEILAKNLNPKIIKHVWLCHLSAENNLPRIAYETCQKQLSEAGYKLEGDNANLRLDVLARRTPSLVTEIV